MKKSHKKVLLIGWDSADWKIINPLMDAGLMPALQSLVENGVCGNIATLDPPLSPMLWTSIATGKRPHKHGILGFLEPDASGSKLRQTHITSRKVKAIWNILNQQGMRSNVVGWWPSHPAEPVNGTIISNFFQTANFYNPGGEWPLPKGCVHPATDHDFFASLRIHPTELSEAHILPFIPHAASIDQEKDKSLVRLTRQLAECASIHNAATYILEQDSDWDFMGIYYEAPDLISHSFMKFHPPKMDHIPQDKFDLYKDVVTGIYRFHDMMLSETLKLIDEDTTVIIVSDHGFYSDHLRPKSLPKEPAAIAMEHSPYGIFAAKGPGIKKDERIFGASILDITPTLLTLYGLPVGSDMDGKPLLQIFEDNLIPDSVPSWEYIPGDSGQHPAEMKADLYEVKDDKALQQLADLGYIEQPGAVNDTQNFTNNIRENKFYLARSYFNANEFTRAIEILEELAGDPEPKYRYLRYLMECQLRMNNITRCRELLDILKKQHDKETFGSLLLEGQVLFRENNLEAALDRLERAEKLSTNEWHSRLSLADAYRRLNRTSEAITVYRRELEYDPNSHSAYYGLGLCYFENGDYEKSIDALLDSIGLLYFNPLAHFHLGDSFAAAGMYEEAAQAYETAVRLSPKMKPALRKLEKICREFLNDEARYLKLFNEDPYQNAPEIFIVSGLPRSGTSMMMQLLEAGGLPIFTDNLRMADENNQKGYYEHEAVKIIHRDNSWMKQAIDKTVKVVSHLLPYIPLRYKYKVVFMERDLNEILISQEKMLQNMGKLPEKTTQYALENNFRQNIDNSKNWLKDKPNVDVLYINYSDALNNPDEVLQQLNNFFGQRLNMVNMRTVIDRNLYRTQHSS